MSDAVDGRNKFVMRAADLRLKKTELGLQWLEARVKYGQLKGQLERNFVEGGAAAAWKWVKDHGPVMAFFMVLVNILKSCTAWWLQAIGYAIQAYRLTGLGISIIRGIQYLTEDAMAPAIENLERLRVLLEQYKQEIDQYYDQYDLLLKLAWPEVEEAKRKFDKEYERVIIIEQTIKKLHDVGAMDALKLLYDLYQTIERLETLGTDWVHKFESFIDKAVTALEIVLKVLSLKLEGMRAEIEAMMRKREQDYQDCLRRGRLPKGTWHRPMPEFLRDSDGHIIGVFQGS